MSPDNTESAVIDDETLLEQYGDLVDAGGTKIKVKDDERVETAKLRAQFIIELAQSEEHARLREVLDPKFLGIKDSEAASARVLALSHVEAALRVLRIEVQSDRMSDDHPPLYETLGEGRIRNDYPSQLEEKSILEHTNLAIVSSFQVESRRNIGSFSRRSSSRRRNRMERMNEKPSYHHKTVIIPTDEGWQLEAQFDAYQSKHRSNSEQPEE